MPDNRLRQLLGKGFSFAACIGLVIGLGIMRTPGEIATTVTDPGLYMLLWLACGLFVLLSLSVVAELIAMTPRSGGIYALVAHAYGPYPGFLIGWTDWVASCAAMALKAVVMLEYVALLAPEVAPHQTVIAVSVSTFFALLQLSGVRIVGGVQQFASAVMALIMFGLAIALFLASIRHGGPIDAPTAQAPAGTPGVAAFGLVIAAIVFTYDGWYAASYFGEEVKSGGAGVAQASLRAAAIILIIYITLNLALVRSVPLEALIGHDLALAGALDLVYGVGAGTLVFFAAIFILLSHQNLQYMIASRILYALSSDGLGTRRATSVNDRGTPAGATILTWALTCGLIIIGQFELLLSLVTILFMAMYVSLVIGVFKLRRQEPDAERPYRAWGYPYSGVVCTIGWIAVALFVAATSRDSTAYGLGLTAISIPAYLYLKRRRALGAAMT